MNLAFRLAAGSVADLPPLPGSLRVNRRLSQWLRVDPGGTVEVRPGKVEIGQGILTALVQIAAEELDVSPSRIRVMAARTGASPDEAVTSGSLSIQECGVALRFACAEARAILVAHAAARMKVAPESLIVENGEVIATDGRRISYWSLADHDVFDREVTASVAPKPGASHRLVGTSAARIDLPDKVFGRAAYLHDLSLPGMLHGRVLRPPSPGATLRSFDPAAARSLGSAVSFVRSGSFLGVIAEDEHDAVKAVELLRGCTMWDEQAGLPGEDEVVDWLRSQPAETTIVDETLASADAPGSTLAGSRSSSPARGAAQVRTFRARYSKPFLAHASIGPSCAVACWSAPGQPDLPPTLHVWSHTQGVYNLRADLALALDVAAETVVVEHVQGAGCYGHNGADDVALDAALLARAVEGRPVRVVWSRADELGWSPFGPAMRIEIEADVDVAGSIVGWRHEIWGNGHASRPGRAKTPTLLAAAHLDPPFERPVAVDAPLAAGGGAERNAVPPYEVGARRIVAHRLRSMPIRTSALRSLGAFGNVFAIESMIDEIASALAVDPVEFRLQRLADPRARAVIEAAARRACWHRRGAARAGEGRGRGIGYARYKNTGAWCAVIAEVEAEASLRVRRLVIAVDVGEAINPDGVASQIEGGAIQATSWVLGERVRHDRTRITSTSWDDYPVLRFSDIPAVEVEIVSRPDQPPLGAGEAALGPTAGAIANAVADALGARVRDLPITLERIAALPVQDE